MAEAVIESGLSRLTRTGRKSVPQARQYWLAWRSSDPQLGQNIISALYGDMDSRVQSKFVTATASGSDRPCYFLRSALSERDRKSTRLNSSHLVSSYAVFCLK